MDTSGYGPSAPTALHPPPLYMARRLVQTTHAKAIEIMREKLSHLDRSVLESRYASVGVIGLRMRLLNQATQTGASAPQERETRATFTATSLAPTDPEAQTALALALYRSGEYAKAPAVDTSPSNSAHQSSEASPIAAAAEAMICFRLGDETHISQSRAPPELKDLQSDLDEHQARGPEQLCRVILAEAEALINGVQPK